MRDIHCPKDIGIENTFSGEGRNKEGEMDKILKELNSFLDNWYGDMLNHHKCATCSHCYENLRKNNEMEIMRATTQMSHMCDDYFYADIGIKTEDNGAGFWVVECPEYKKAKDFYKIYTQTSHWKAIRRQRIEMDGFRCAKCKSPLNLNVHHITYERLGCEDMEDLVTLCEKCHKDLHKMR